MEQFLVRDYEESEEVWFNTEGEAIKYAEELVRDYDVDGDERHIVVSRVIKIFT